MKKEIACSTCEFYMEDFLEHRITGDGEELRDFLNHVLECKDCYEELEIKYLVSEVLNRLERGDTIDTQRELKQKVENARRALRMFTNMQNLYSSIEVIAAVCVVMTILNGILRYI